MKKLVDPEKCNGCLQCQMVCSLAFHGLISPEMSAIKVRRKTAAPYNFEVCFTDACRSACRLCVERCTYGCLTAI